MGIGKALLKNGVRMKMVSIKEAVILVHLAIICYFEGMSGRVGR